MNLNIPHCDDSRFKKLEMYERGFKFSMEDLEISAHSIYFHLSKLFSLLSKVVYLNQNDTLR